MRPVEERLKTGHAVGGGEYRLIRGRTQARTSCLVCLNSQDRRWARLENAARFPSRRGRVSRRPPRRQRPRPVHAGRGGSRVGGVDSSYRSSGRWSRVRGSDPGSRWRGHVAEEDARSCVGRFVVIRVEPVSCRRTRISNKSSAALGPSFFMPKSSRTSRSTRVSCCTKSRRLPVARPGQSRPPGRTCCGRGRDGPRGSRRRRWRSPCAICRRRGDQLHDAHHSQTVTVYYRWHPLYGQTCRCGGALGIGMGSTFSAASPTTRSVRCRRGCLIPPVRSRHSALPSSLSTRS